MITIKGTEYFYDDSEIINFSEGLIGLPEMRRAVLIAMSEFEPFCWLASLENENTRFIVVDPLAIFTSYDVSVPGAPGEPKQQTLAIVKVSSDWQKTTINLRAPIVIDAQKKTGSQLILSDSNYQFAETLPQV